MQLIGILIFEINGFFKDVQNIEFSGLSVI